jgi:hypothetical protein
VHFAFSSVVFCLDFNPFFSCSYSLIGCFFFLSLFILKDHSYYEMYEKITNNYKFFVCS